MSAPITYPSDAEMVSVADGGVHRYVYAPDGRRVLVAYAPTAWDATVLLQKALGTTVDVDAVRFETEAEGRAWETSTLASRVEGYRKK